MKNVIAGVIAFSFLASASRAHATDEPVVKKVPLVIEPSPEPRKVRFNERLYVGGLVMIGLGSAAMIVGVAGWATAVANLDRSKCLGLCSDLSPLAFFGVGLTGVVTAIVGIPLAVIGGHRVTRVTASVGPTGGALRVTF